MTTALDMLRTDEAALRKELETAGVQFRGRVCKCPFHDDRTPSAGIYVDKKDGAWKFKCQGCGFGGDIIDVRAKLNKRTPAEELRAMNDAAAGATRSRTPATQPKIFQSMRGIVSALPNVEDAYTDLYAAPDGTEEFSIVRWRNQDGKKAFTQCSKTAGGWWMKAPPAPLPVANRKGIAAAEKIIVVEGEKCVRALNALGLVATTSPGGALKGEHADWTPLAGKDVTLWPDMDAPDSDYPEGKGVEHMRRVQKILQTLSPPPTLYWFNPKSLDLPVKGDAADLVARYRETFPVEETRAIIEDLLADAEPIGIAAEFEKEMEATIAGQRRSLAFPWTHLSAAARALLPGKVTCVCGDGGAGKSLFLSDCIVEWYQFADFKFCVYHMEDDRNYHLSRILAQIAGDSRLTDPDWIEQHPTHVREYVRANKRAIEEIGRCIWEAPDDDVSLEMLSVWVEERAKAGFDVIIVDPITASQGSKSFIEDLRFLTKVKLTARRHGCRVILVTHPRTGTKQARATHNDMAGGAAYPRFSHTVLWVERNDTESQFLVKAGFDARFPEYLTPNRIVSIPKARNGPGAGRKIAFTFNPATLRFTELGMIQRETQHAA